MQKLLLAKKWRGGILIDYEVCGKITKVNYGDGSTVLCAECSDLGKKPQQKVPGSQRQKQNEVLMAINSLKSMVLGIGIMLLGGFILIVLYPEFGILIVLAGLGVMLHGFFSK